MRPLRSVPSMVLAAATLAAPMAAQASGAFMACRGIGAGMGWLAEAVTFEGSKARARLAGAEAAHFEKNLPAFLASESPAADAVFAEVGSDPESLLAEARDCVLNGACAEDLAGRLQSVAEGLGDACLTDMRETN